MLNLGFVLLCLCNSVLMISKTRSDSRFSITLLTELDLGSLLQIWDTWSSNRNKKSIFIPNLFSCPLGSWVSLWIFETIRGSLMKP